MRLLSISSSYSSVYPTITSSNSLFPVPAGILCPTITFSFNPSKESILPFIAASFKTLVVSWNEAADINDLVCNEALVIPCKIGVAVALTASRAVTRFLSSLFKIEFSSLRSLADTICPSFNFKESPADSITFFP